MNRISQITTKLFAVPLGEAMGDARHPVHTHFELVTVTVRLEDGSEGTGYTYTGGKGGRAIVAMIEHDLGEALLGRDGEDIEALNEFCGWQVHYVGRGGIASFAISAIDIALWDLRCRRLGQPLWRVAGGAQASCRAYAGGIDLLYPLPRLLDQIRDYLERGFNGVKIKVGR